MKTDALIDTLVTDLAPTRIGFRRMVTLSLIAGAVVSALVFVLAVHARSDLSAMATSPRLWFKFAVTGSLAIAAFGLAPRLATPGVSARRWAYALLAPVAMALLGVMAECLSAPSAQWMTRLVGNYAVYCLTLIPLLSLGPLIALILALRGGAPENPGLAGAAAGLLASGVGSTIYALHCTDDSPLFVVAWYSLAMATVTLAGFFAGKRWLRW